MEKIEFENIQIRIGNNNIMNNGYLAIQMGTILAVLGRNGTGKSMLFETLFKSRKSSDLICRVNNRMIGTNELRSMIKYLPQHHFIPKRFAIGRVFNDYHVDFYEFSDYFPELKVKIDSKISSLSEGERRILEVYLIIKTSGCFCILDEPFSSIMPIHVEKIKRLIEHAKHSKGIVISDHSFQDIWSVSDFALLMNNGSLKKITRFDELQSFGYKR